MAMERMDNATANDKLRSFRPALLDTRTQMSCGVMSLRVIGNPLDALWWVLPALAQVSHTDRWTVWLGPPFRPDSSCFKSLGFNLSHTRVVYRDNETSRSLDLVEHALRCATNALVLAWPLHCDDQDLAQLQTAAQEGGSFGLVFMPDGFLNQKSLSKKAYRPRPEYTRQLNFELPDELVSRSSSTC
ncbi:MAG: SulA-like leucine-rich domain-containing protein [Arenicellales bacterium]|nr:SulA-like leucine-rich domain-containing protein [Arenicellales bacterium]